MRVIIVCENASTRMSGETLIPLYYFRKMRERGVEVHLVSHARCRLELREILDADDYARVHFIEETLLQRSLWAAFGWLPDRVRGLLLDQVLHLITQRRARDVVKRLVREHGIEVVFEPAPISPSGISCMYRVDAKVVVGPLCGGLDFPPAFRYMDGIVTRAALALGRRLSVGVHRLFPGKLAADVVLIGNRRTEKALPSGCRGAIHEVPESGVDLSLWQRVEPREAQAGQPVRFVFVGRFVDWKGIEFLVEAFAKVVKRTAAELDLIGDGELFEATKAQVARLAIGENVRFHGRLPLLRAGQIVRACDVYVAPSLRECGGCAILESMALGMPIISCNWAGPAEYLAHGAGMLIEPTSRESFIDDLADGMLRLAESPLLRRELGAAAYSRVRSGYYDWDSKTNRVLAIFAELLRPTKKSRDASLDAGVTPGGSTDQVPLVDPRREAMRPGAGRLVHQAFIHVMARQRA